MTAINLITSTYRAVLFGFILFLCIVPSICVYAQSSQQTVEINIAAQPLSQAITQLATQMGILIGVDARLVADKQASAINGRYTPEQAITKLLTGSGLVAVENAPGQYTLEFSHVNPQNTSILDRMLLPEITVASPMEGDSPHNMSYNRRNASTATKTDTLIMETPINIQVVPQQVMKDQQVTRIETALENVSGVFKAQAESAESFTIRGFRTFDFYRNGVRNQSALTQAGDREVANLERIEVLKGPAAILYGRIEPGGMINLVTKQPLATSYHALQQQFGSFNQYRTTVDSTGPLTKDNTLLYRVNLAYENKGSFREFVENERVFIAPVVKWNISDRTQATFEMEYKRAEESTDFGIPAAGNRPVNIPRKRNLGEPFTFSKSDEFLGGVNWSHEFNDQWKIKHTFNTMHSKENDNVVIGSGLELDNRTFLRNFAGFRDNKAKTYMNVIDITGRFDTFGIQHTLLLGGDHYHFNNTALIIGNSSFPSIDIFKPIHSGTPARNPDEDFGFNTTERWFGLFLQDQIKLPYNVHLLAGLRYDNARLSSTGTFAGESSTNASTDQAVKPRFGVLWHPLPEVSFYGNYVQNFGSSNVFFRDASGKSLAPELAEQFETGIKTEWLEGRLNATLAWFHLTKTNIAVPNADPDLALRGISATAGEARNSGIELDISGEVFPGWRIIGSYSYIDSEITKQTDGTEGNRLFGVPKHAAAYGILMNSSAKNCVA